jgi:hypothetical protein
MSSTAFKFTDIDLNFEWEISFVINLWHVLLGIAAFFEFTFYHEDEAIDNNILSSPLLVERRSHSTRNGSRQWTG